MHLTADSIAIPVTQEMVEHVSGPKEWVLPRLSQHDQACSTFWDPTVIFSLFVLPWWRDRTSQRWCILLVAALQSEASPSLAPPFFRGRLPKQHGDQAMHRKVIKGRDRTKIWRSVTLKMVSSEVSDCLMCFDP